MIEYEGNAATAGAFQASPSSKGSQVFSMIEREAAELDQLHGAINQLEERLAPVVVPRPDRETVAGSQPREVMAPLADRIAGHGDNVANATARIRSLMNALEI